MNVTLASVKLRGVLPRLEKLEDRTSQGSYEGRWLTIAASGECLMDYVHGACDAERALPLNHLCSLAVAMQQFIHSACQQGTEGTMTHAVAFDSFILAICAGSNLSVLAVVASPEATKTMNSSCTTAVLRYKAMELHAMLSHGELGDAFRKLAESSHESRAEKVADYTLSSCLTEDVSSIELPREVASAARDAFAAAFSRSYEALLADAFATLPVPERSMLRHMCIVDRRLEFLATLSDSPDTVEAEEAAVGSLEVAGPSGELQDRPEQQEQLIRCVVEGVMAKGDKGISVWTWQVPRCVEVAVVSNLAPLLVVAVLELKMAEGLAMTLTNAGSMVRRILPEEVDLHQRTAPVAGMLDSISKKLCQSLGAEYPTKSSVVVEAAG